MSKFQAKLQEDRKNEETSNAGLKWEQSDDDTLVELAVQNTPISDIAKRLRRTEGSIKTRIVINSIWKSKNDNISYDDAAALFNISVDEMNNYEQKKTQREDKKKNKSYNKQQQYQNNFPPSDYVEVLEGLTQMHKKQDDLKYRIEQIHKLLTKQ